MEPYYHDEKHGITLYHGDCLDVLRSLPDESVNCCVTSPPYWGLRDYGIDGQIGLETNPDQYVAKLVGVFQEVRRVLRDDGTIWLNLGDSYNGYMANQRAASISANNQHARPIFESGRGRRTESLKAKDLCGIPWRVAFALQADGWYLRQDIIWHKPNPMPESVTDRCTKAHEYIFLLAKSERYYFNQEAIKIPAQPDSDARYDRGRSDNHKWADGGPGNQTIARSLEHMRKSGNRQRKPASARGVPVGAECGINGAVAGSIPWEGSTANRRSVWTVTTQPFPGAHFATFPPKLIEPCILAGCPAGGIVLDPFTGSGTTAYVARRLGCGFVGAELNENYCKLAAKRLRQGVLQFTD